MDKELQKISQSMTTASSVEDKEDKVEDKVEDSKEEPESALDNELSEDLSSIWADIETLKTALISVEQGMLALTKRMDGFTETCKRNNIFRDNKLEAAEKRLDSQVSVYEKQSNCLQKSI